MPQGGIVPAVGRVAAQGREPALPRARCHRVEAVSWDDALDKLAKNIKTSRDRTFVTTDAAGNVVNRCEGIAFAGGAAFSSEEGYLTAKVMRSLGLVHLEQQARV